jgi:1-aminocyclopropane-1-carboxylate deaminase/D-cysteine desulfhydrase-like pyridoxal-dependent ACC family enzyme
MTLNLAPVTAILAAQPRRRLHDDPSPIQRLRRLERELGGEVEIWIKRDDLLRPLCGNKVRYLEFVLGAYDAAGANCLVHCGGQTSNYMAQIAMVGAAEGVPVHLALLGERPEKLQANVLIEEVFGARVVFRPGRFGGSCSRFKAEIADELRDLGRRPFVVDHPFSNHSAMLGYMAFYAELRGQIARGEAPEPDHIHLCSAGNSYLGLRLAADLAGDRLPVTGFPPLRWAEAGLDHVAPDRPSFLRKKAVEFAAFAAVALRIPAIDVDDSFVGPGYGEPTPESVAAVRLLARTEGVLLDPIYTGKSMAGVIARIRAGQVRRGARILFVHTGGAANLFTYADAFNAAREAA